MNSEEVCNQALRKQKSLQTILVKPAGPDCNMACDYCFYLEKERLFGESTKHRMSETILRQLIRQVMHQAGKEISFTWQGGEPLLMGLEFYKKVIEFQQEYGFGQIVGNGLQTNGLLIDDQWVQFLLATNWLVGLSLDGPMHVHDRFRRKIGGDPTWQIVINNAEKMLDVGVAVNALTVVNEYSVHFPEEIYTFHKGIGFQYMQFIPCVEIKKGEFSGMHSCNVPSKDYGMFLCRLFDLWTDDFENGVPTTSIRIFDSLFHYYLGLAPPECQFMKECGNYVVVEHNGDVYACDFFVESMWHLGNLEEELITCMLNGNLQTAFGRQKAYLPDVCLACKWLGQCQGGCIKDRLAGTGGKINYLCDSYKTFYEYSDQRFRKLASLFKNRQTERIRTERTISKSRPEGPI